MQTRIHAKQLFVAAIGFFASLLLAVPSAEAEETNWQVSDITTSCSKRLRSFIGKEKRHPQGTILEIKATVRLADPEKASVDVGTIAMEVRTDGQCMPGKLLGVGIAGLHGTSSYDYPEDVGPQGTTIGMATGKYRLRRQGKDGPVLLTVLKNPSRLSFAFAVPRDPSAEYKLTLGDCTVCFKQTPAEGTAEAEETEKKTATSSRKPEPKKTRKPPADPLEAAASSQFARARQLVIDQKYLEAEKALQQIVDKYGHTRTAEQARKLLTAVKIMNE